MNKSCEFFGNTLFVLQLEGDLVALSVQCIFIEFKSFVLYNILFVLMSLRLTINLRGRGYPVSVVKQSSRFTFNFLCVTLNCSASIY